MFKQDLLDRAMAEVLNLLDHHGYNVVYVAVQGSTNYNLDVYSDEYMSDVDFKAFVMPSFMDLYNNRKVSKTYQTNYGQVEVKDVRLLPELLGKMNMSYLELLYTPHYFVGEGFEEDVECWRERADFLVQERFALLVKSMRGMALEKANAMCHEYEGLKDKLAAFGGYDPKQLHHAYRLLFMLENMVEQGNGFGDSLVFEGAVREFLLNVKVNGVGDVLTAQDMMDNVVEQVQALYEKVWENKTPKSEYLVHSDTLNNMEVNVFCMVRNYFLKD